MNENNAVHRAVENRAGAVVPYLMLPREVVRACGVPLHDAPPLGFAARIWSGKAWLPGELAGVFAFGTQPGGTGAPCVSAAASRTVERTDLGAEVWDCADLRTVLRGAEFRGLVFALTTSHGDVVDVTPYPPAGALCAALEGVQGELDAWLEHPTVLLKSWAVSLVVSRFPWPNETNTPVGIGLLEQRVLRHFWSPADGLDGTVLTSDTLLGWATAWSDHLGNAVSRAGVTAHAVHAPGLQYRLGAGRDLLNAWAEFKNAGMV